MRDLKVKLIRKFIPLMAITGSCGGITGAAMLIAGSENTFFESGLTTFIYILAGTVAGLIATVVFEIKGKDVVSRNVKGNPLVINQPAYLLTAVAVIIAFIMNMKSGTGTGVVSAIFYGFAFLLGISNGIFDYNESVNKNVLYTGAFPIGLTFVYSYYMNRTGAAIDAAWIFGSIYLFSYLLFINRMQLNSIIFFRKSINIEDSKKIRIFNDWLIIVFYCLYLVMFNFRKLIGSAKDVLMKLFEWALFIMQAITDWLMAEIPKTNRKELLEKEKLDAGEEIVSRPWMELLLKIVMYIIFSAIIIGAIISIVIMVIKIIKKIKEKFRLNYNKASREKRIESKEYEEESEIVKEEKNNSSLRSRRKKFNYNIKNLSKIPLAGDKIRYVYGFVLERLYHKHVNIEESDTPEEIINRIRRHRNGEKLNKMGFEEFTEKYERVRYGNKEVDADENLAKTGEKFEKAISDIYVEPGKRTDEKQH